MSTDTDSAKTYFDRLAPEYDRAFRLQGRSLLNAAVNRFFRGPTFRKRMLLMEKLFGELGVNGRSVLDLGCGSGQVSLLLASMGATVHGIDIAPRMLEIARETAQRTGVAERCRFEEGDVCSAPLPESDLVLLVGVVEYYADYAELLKRAAAACRDTLVIAHTNRVPYRMALRRLLFAIDRANLYFHPMPEVIAAATAAGLTLAREQREHAFTILVFRRA
ncbi:MAG: methyltransferase domain-containing protein [Vicinamibacteria bacterium]|jgi:2-polyprenyl-3-methyl-5-hydroxy-6-metoxy-1,4-benzoquinol methylase|nr:methyltransferase domain-containing protein [Vicinamibacteria bacterium]